MIEVTVVYPAGQGRTFNMDYYWKAHIPLFQKRMGAAMKTIQVSRGIGGRKVSPGGLDIGRSRTNLTQSRLLPICTSVAVAGTMLPTCSVGRSPRRRPSAKYIPVMIACLCLARRQAESEAVAAGACDQTPPHLDGQKA
jgi:hypothetical protein